VAYIAATLETGDADFVRDALGLVARARGMGEIAKNAGLNRESLYKALGETGNPEFGTVMRIVRALGLTLSARPRRPDERPGGAGSPEQMEAASTLLPAQAWLQCCGVSKHEGRRKSAIADLRA
jgi:probable addiction module antidote protein